jgi:hypothetical protein
MNAIKLFSLAPPAPSGGAWGEASPQTPAKHSSRVSGGLDMGDVLRFPLPSMRRVRPRLLHAPRLAVRPGAPATALTSTLSIIHRTLFLAGVWGEASPQAPLEARWTAGRSRRSSQPWAGGARSDIQASPKARWTVGPRVGSREPGSHGRGSRAS